MPLFLPLLGGGLIAFAGTASALEHVIARGGGTYAGLANPGGQKGHPLGGWSQYNQDVFVVNHPPPGGWPAEPFFVEIGGFDGEQFSNSLYLEKKLGWDGLLVEANPVTYNLLKSRDRKCLHTNACVSDTVKSMDFLVAGAITTSVELGSTAMKERIKDEMALYGKDSRWSSKDHAAGSKITTACLSLQSAMKHINKTRIDYFSLDVEGSEVSILQSIGFGYLDIDLVSIEVQEHQDQIYAFMVSKGYTRIQKHQDSGGEDPDDWFRKNRAFQPRPAAAAPGR